MQCEGVAIRNGFIECSWIEPNDDLPGFFNLIDNEQIIRTINGACILEVVLSQARAAKLHFIEY